MMFLETVISIEFISIMRSILFIVACCIAFSSAFRLGGLRTYLSLHRVKQISHQATNSQDGHTSIPEEVAKLHAINDMILVERLSAPLVTAGGIVLPKTEGRDLKPLGRVLSIPPSSSVVIDHSSRKAEKVYIPFKVGDVVAIRVSGFLLVLAA